jgi:L-alanine-DL-glutamate epimerase-like enolase superfamily enzyme
MATMHSAAPTFRVLRVDCFERPVRYRLPFRFGAATVDTGVQAFVRARIRLADGRESDGATAELMVPKWFDKDPARSNDDNIAALRASLCIAAEAYANDRALRTGFGHFAAHALECRMQGERLGMPALAAAFGAAEVDRAVLDALCRALGQTVFDAMRRDAVGFDPTVVAPELPGFDGRAFLATLAPVAGIAVRHTVGMVDALGGSPRKIDDGLPESLEEAIARYGLRWFKLKLSGDPRADLARLRDVAAVLDRLPDYRATLDGNEQYGDLDALGELIRGIDQDRALGRLAAAIGYIEQPLPRQATLEHDVAGVAARFPLLIDEADGTLDAFGRAAARGYRGVSSKSCKGLYKSLINAARCAAWNASGGHVHFFVSAEDLTAPAGLAVQQDTALAAVLGLAHVERNGHHYIDGMSGAPPDEQRAFATAHPGFYERAHGSTRLAIRAGTLALLPLHVPGFASASLPDFPTLSPLQGAQPATARA